MATTNEQMRAWTGPAIFGYGFRPFFFSAGLWAALAMVLWIPMLSGHLLLPTAFDPVSWHAHEFLFGYISAVIAGFLFTAVPNWTGRLPIVGWPLAALWSVWLAGRIAVAFSALLPPLLVAIVDLAFLVAFAMTIGREIVRGRNWRNLVVLVMLSVLAIGNAVFHLEAASGGFAAEGYGLRIGLGAGILMISVIGGRIVPSFTRNWLVRRGPGRLPVPPAQRLDQIAVGAMVLAVLLWVSLPGAALTGGVLMLVGLLHLVRLARWAGERTAAEPLVLVLHVGYLFVPLGALALGLAILMPEAIAPAAVQHLWMAGALGLMTLAVMTRATLGHTGQPLTAGLAISSVYVAVVVAVLARLAAGIWPGQSTLLYMIAGTAWIGAFGGYVLIFGPRLLTVPAARRL